MATNPEGEGTPVTTRCCTVTTKTGSKYRITEEHVECDCRSAEWPDGRVEHAATCASHQSTFHVWCDNVENPHSRRINPGLGWEVERPDPWPPRLGRVSQYGFGIALISIYDEQDHPDRMPGGGRWTSPIVDIKWED